MTLRATFALGTMMTMVTKRHPFRSAAYSALLKRLLATTDKAHRNMIVVAWETENGSEAELINARARQDDADAELVQITTEMTTWLNNGQ